MSADRDRNLFSFYETSDGQTVDWTGRVVGSSSASPDWDDALKFTSKLRDFRGTFDVVFGGKEDVADLNNECRNVHLEIREAHVQGDFGFTVKGGCEDISIAANVASGRGKVCDVNLGNYSAQSDRMVRAVRLRIERADGAKTRVRVLRSEVPHFVNGADKYEFVFPRPGAWYHGIVARIMVWLRF